MKQFMLSKLAQLLATPRVAEAIIARAQKTPYMHLYSPDGKTRYMSRWWLFNPYDRKTNRAKYRWFPWSIRVHHIRVPDQDPHLHDHPWDARTFILKGGYIEQRPLMLSPITARQSCFVDRYAGQTFALKHGEYHRIDSVSAHGAFTLFITSRYRGPWGFLVDGAKVYWKDYLSARAERKS